MAAPKQSLADKILNFFKPIEEKNTTDDLLAKYAAEDEAARLYNNLAKYEKPETESDTNKKILAEDQIHKNEPDFIDSLKKQLNLLEEKLRTEYKCPLTQDTPEVPITLNGESATFDKDMLMQYYSVLIADGKTFESPCSRRKHKRDNIGPLIEESRERFVERVFSVDKEKAIQINTLQQDIKFLKERLRALGVQVDKPKPMIRGPRPKLF